MTIVPAWWQKPRRITVVVDNPSWILPTAERLVADLSAAGEHCRLARNHDEVPEGDVAFYLGCVRITPPAVLAHNRRNLVVHASDLPKGRGFSPLTWMVLEGERRIPVCLIEAAEQVDAGPIVLRDEISFAGHELLEELRSSLAASTYKLCRTFLDHAEPPEGLAQVGESSFYRRRTSKDSRIDPHVTIADQFDLLRTVDNKNWPAFFDHRGCRYRLIIDKIPSEDG
jgi:methionyl-tRNA formyltransferase